MGGRPVSALAVVGFPLKSLAPELMAEVLAGGAAACAEAGIAIVGGHSIDLAEPIFGLAVTGVVHPDQLLRNSAARPGDVLVLTKPLGIGSMAQAVKKGLLDEAGYAEMLRLTTTLNRGAAEAALEVGCHAATDVTGFGLLGHLHGMAAGSGVSAELELAAVPVIGLARELLAQGIKPGATGRNLAGYGDDVDWGPAGEIDRWILADPQTSGGLLLSVAPERAEALVAALRARGTPAAAIIGRVLPPDGARIRVR